MNKVYCRYCGNLIDEGGVYGDENTPMDEAIRGILETYQIPMNQSMTLLSNFRDLWDRALGA